MDPDARHGERRERDLRGWGFVGEGLDAPARAALAGAVEDHLGVEVREREPGPLAAVPAPRLVPPAALAVICATDDATRRLHAVGRSYPDVVRAFRGELGDAPDVVAQPRDADEVEAVLSWCSDTGAACIPFGGGTSVVGGVDAAAVRADRAVVVLQTRRMDRVVAIDRTSRAALVEAGATGPVLEEQLRPAGLTVRFFPQSFELSTVGGWIATRAAGHFATGPTHIDDLVEAVDAVTPAGRWSSRRLPASGAGPSPDRLLLGSEGTLGVVTQAWLRLQERPSRRARCDVRFSSFAAAIDGVRTIVQAGLRPAGCRVLDPAEALLNGVPASGGAVLLLSFESAALDVRADAEAALTIARDAGGASEGVLDDARPGGEAESTSAWRASFLRAPYVRDALVRLAVLSDTFETAATWDRLPDLVEDVSSRVRAALTDVCGAGVVTARTTHAYADGAAAYFTMLAPVRPGSELIQWRQLKDAAGEAVMACAGTITHHHAVGRDHRPWYERQRPPPFASALRAAKSALDPAGVLNPGVLLDPA